MQTTQGPCFSMQTGLITAECCVRGSEPRPLESCYQCAARRYSSCFNSSPYVPSDPSRLTWQDSSFPFSICCQLGHTFCFVCLSCCFSFLKQLSPHWQLFQWFLPLEHHCPPPLHSLSCQCENKGAAQTITPTCFSPSAHLQISPSFLFVLLSSSPVLHLHFFTGLCFSSRAAALMPLAQL